MVWTKNGLPRLIVFENKGFVKTKSEESLPKLLIYKNLNSDHKILFPEM